MPRLTKAEKQKLDLLQKRIDEMLEDIERSRKFIKERENRYDKQQESNRGGKNDI